MSVPMRELKEGAGKIAERFELQEAEAIKIISYYSARGLWDDVRKVLSFDMDKIRESATAQNIAIDPHEESEAGKPTETKPKKRKPQIIPESERITGFLPNYGSGAGLVKGELPDDLPDLIQNYIDIFSERFKIEDISKASAERWRGFCMMFGYEVKKSRLLEDIEREKKEGGKIFDAERVRGLLELWATLCASYDKVPLAGDFISFSGISSSWFYDNNGSCALTSSSVGIYKRLMELQEVGISGRLIDGRRNPTGSIFFLKNWHGWKDQREVVHIDENKGATAQGLPMFDD